MKYVFYDLETTGKNKDWSQIIQFGAVCVDEKFNELDRFETRCRLKTGVGQSSRTVSSEPTDAYLVPKVGVVYTVVWCQRTCGWFQRRHLGLLFTVS